MANYYYLVCRNDEEKELLVTFIDTSIDNDLKNKDVLEEWFNNIDTTLKNIERKIKELWITYDEITPGEMSVLDNIKLISLINDVVELLGHSPSTTDEIVPLVKLAGLLYTLKHSDKDYEYSIIDTYSESPENIIDEYKQKGYSVVFIR